MDVLFGEPENSQDPAHSKLVANSMYVSYSSTSPSCASSNMFPSNCGDCLPSNKQQSFLSDASSTSSVLPFLFQKGLLVCLPSLKEDDFSAEHNILQYENRWNLDVQSDLKSPAQIIAGETTKNLESNVEYVQKQYSLGKEVLPPPGFESLASVWTSIAALTSTSVVPLLNSVDATPVSVASPRSASAPSWSPVALQLLSKPISSYRGTGNQPKHVRESGSVLLTTANQELITRSLLLTAVNEETRTGSSLLTTANQEEGGAFSLLTMANQKTNCKAAKSELYKTELCRAFSENGSCGYGDKCQFAHGEWDQRAIHRHAKYKTKQCWTYHSTGFCYYGARCNFIHDENRLDRSTKLTSVHEDSSDPEFVKKLDPASGISLDQGLRTDLSPESRVKLTNTSLGVNLDAKWAVYGDPRLDVNSVPNLELKLDLVGFGLNSRVERPSNLGVELSLKSRIAPNLKAGISLNSQPKSEQTVKSHTWQISNGTMPISNGTVPISNGTVPISYGMVPITNGKVPVSYGMVPFSSGMVRNSPLTATLNLDAMVAPSADQTLRQRNQCNTLKWNFRNQSLGHPPAFTDAKPPEASASAARDNDIAFKHSRSEFSRAANEDRFAKGQPRLSPPQLPSEQNQVISASMLHPSGHFWNKQNGLLGMSSNQNCTEGLSSSHTLMAPTSNVWSSMIKHPKCWTLS